MPQFMPGETGGIPDFLRPRKKSLIETMLERAAQPGAPLATPPLDVPQRPSFDIPPFSAPPQQPPPIPGRPDFVGPTQDMTPVQGLEKQYRQATARPSLKQALLGGLVQAAPIAIGGLLGGEVGAYGATQGVEQAQQERGALEAEQRKSLLQQIEAEKQRQERMGEKELAAQVQREGHEERLKGITAQNETRQAISENTNAVRQSLGEAMNANRARGLDIREADVQSLQEYRKAQSELANARIELDRAKNDPTSPAFKLAQQRVDVASRNHDLAAQRLGLSEQTFNARYRGTDNAGNALPGALITDTGEPVGSSFSQNVRPTGTERSRADLAKSAREQVDTMKDIVKRRKDIFGPAAGRKTDLTVWLGSQDPDAQRFLTAQTTAADHMAGAFGGVAATTIENLRNSTGRLKDNPEAIAAALDQVGISIDQLQKAGTVRTAGSDAAKGLGKIKVIAPDGKTGTIPFEDWPAAQKEGYKRAK